MEPKHAGKAISTLIVGHEAYGKRVLIAHAI
jgi:hypothetical protein